MVPQLNNFSNDPFKQLKDRIRLRMQEEMINDKIFAVVKDAYTELLRTENIMLSRTESNRLLRDILKDVLTDMLAEIDKPQSQ